MDKEFKKLKVEYLKKLIKPINLKQNSSRKKENTHCQGVKEEIPLQILLKE